MPVNFEVWAKKYEKKYEDEDVPIQYKGANGSILEEKSPYFESISKVLQKRGYLLKEEFISICEWKTKRQKNRYQENSDEEIKKITKEVISIHPNTKEQVNRLISLKGVGVPVASAILTVIFPSDYCVLDFRAWRALHWAISEPVSFKNYLEYSKFLDDFRKYASLDSYIKYLDEIKNLAKQHNTMPRKIEMALWKYDKDSGGEQN